MQKLLNYLEQHVQWLAIALGGLYLLFVVYGYVLQPPVTADVGPQKGVAPGGIAGAVTSGDGPLPKLEAGIRGGGPVPTMRVDPIATTFQQRIMDVPVPTYPAPWLNGTIYASSIPLSTQLELPANPQQASVPAPQPVRQVTVAGGLPQPPAPKPGPVSSGRSVVDLDRIQGGIIPSVPGAVPGMSGMPPFMGQGYGPPTGFGPPGGFGPPAGYGPPPSVLARIPGAVAAPGVAGVPGAPDGLAADNAGKTAERYWVTPSFVLPYKELARAFEQIPSDMRNTLILRVELEREELGADGNWSDRKAIAPLAVLKLPKLPNLTDKIECESYMEWAAANQPALVAPGFYATVKPDLWWQPGKANPNTKIKPTVSGPPRKAVPAAPTRTRRARTPVGPSYGPPAGYGPPPGYGPSFGGEPAPDDADRPMLAQATPGSGYGPPPGFRPPSGPPTGYGPPPGFRPPYGPPAGYGAPAGVVNAQAQNRTTAAATAAASYDGPIGYFDPTTTLRKDVMMWAHDDTVQPGKTYRYRARYRLLNPLYTRPVGNAKLSGTYLVESPLSEWGSPVALPQTTEFYLASSISPKSGKIKLDLFLWSNGQWTAKPLEISPGDSVAGTNWMLLDIRSFGSEDTFAVFCTDSGTLMRRDYRSDQGNGKYGRFRAQLEAKAKPAVTPGAGPGGFGPPAGFRPPAGYGPPPGFRPPGPPPGVIPGR